jgi:hypothetical protein
MAGWIPGEMDPAVYSLKFWRTGDIRQKDMVHVM